MAIKVHLAEARARAGRKTLTQLAADTGLSLANLSKLDRNATERIDFGTINALCEALNCQPGDLLAYVPGPQEDLMPQIKRRKKAGDAVEKAAKMFGGRIVDKPEVR